MAIRNVGMLDVAEDPESPEYDFSGKTDTCTRTFRGAFDACLAARPKLGETMADTLGDFAVSKVKVKKQKGQRAVMTVLLEREDQDWSSSSHVGDTVRVSTTWQEVERALITNDFFADTSSGLTAEDRAAIIAWEEETDGGLKASNNYHERPGDETSMILGIPEGIAEDYTDLKLKGTEAWLDFYPVTTRVTESAIEPTIHKCGYIDSDCPAQVSGFSHLKVADDKDQDGSSGRWRRTERWRGAPQWDSRLYGTVPTAPAMAAAAGGRRKRKQALPPTAPPQIVYRRYVRQDPASRPPRRRRPGRRPLPVGAKRPLPPDSTGAT